MRSEKVRRKKIRKSIRRRAPSSRRVKRSRTKKKKKTKKTQKSRRASIKKGGSLGAIFNRGKREGDVERQGEGDNKELRRWRREEGAEAVEQHKSDFMNLKIGDKIVGPTDSETLTLTIRGLHRQDDYNENPELRTRFYYDVSRTDGTPAFMFLIHYEKMMKAGFRRLLNVPESWLGEGGAGGGGSSRQVGPVDPVVWLGEGGRGGESAPVSSADLPERVPASENIAKLRIDIDAALALDDYGRVAILAQEIKELEAATAAPPKAAAPAKAHDRHWHVLGGAGAAAAAPPKAAADTEQGR